MNDDPRLPLSLEAKHGKLLSRCVLPCEGSKKDG